MEYFCTLKQFPPSKAINWNDNELVKTHTLAIDQLQFARFFYQFSMWISGGPSITSSDLAGEVWLLVLRVHQGKLIFGAVSFLVLLDILECVII